MTPRYDAWNRALAWRLLQGRVDEPLYIYTDHAVLEEVADDVGVTPGSAVDDFVAAVRATLGGSAPFAGWERISRSPIGDGEVPRYFAVLCFLVLVAVERESTQFSYYPGLNRALGRPVDAGAPPGFDHHVADLFRRFNGWLVASGRGKPTATTSVHFSNIAWPLSQAIVRPTDRALLVRMFSAAGLAPRMPRDGRWLAAQIAPRLTMAATSASRTRLLDLAGRHRDIYSEVLRREYDSWDGSARVVVGPRRALLRLCFEEYSGEWWFVGPTTHGADSTTFNVGTSAGVARPGRTFEAMPAELWRLVGAGRVGKVTGGPDLESRARKVRWLSEDIRVGGWAEVVGRDTAIAQLALVRSGLSQRFSSDPSVAPRDDAPPGHAMYFVPRGVDIDDDNRDDHEAEDAVVPHLENGLALRRQTQTYLLSPGGAPTLVARGATAHVDGVEVALRSGRLELGSLGLGPGEHEVAVGKWSTRIRLVPALRERGWSEAGESWHTGLVSRGRIRVPHENGPVYVVGAGGALVERAVAECRWVKELDLMVTEADVTGLIRSTPFRPRFVVSPHYAGKAWVAPVPFDEDWSDGDGTPSPVDASTARALVSTLLTGCSPAAVESDREWRRDLAALVRRVQGR